jgi:hypothetical protein
VVGVEVAGLEIDGPVAVEDGEDDGWSSGRQPTGAGEVAGARVGADAVGSEYVVVEAACVQVVEHGLAGGAPEGGFAASHVVVEGSSREHRGLWARCEAGLGLDSTYEPQGPAFGGGTGSLGEVFESLADGDAGRFEQQVDGGAAGAAGVAVPALMTAVGGEDADGGCAAGLGSVVG